jgi:hypothetical protein
MRLEIETGSYLTRYSVELTEELPNMATGIIKGATIKPSKE